MMAWPHLLHGTDARGGRSPGMKTLCSHPLHVTIFNGLSLALITWSNCSMVASPDKFPVQARPRFNAEVPPSCYPADRRLVKAEKCFLTQAILCVLLAPQRY